MVRSPRLARDAPSKRYEVEETMTIKLPAKRAARKPASKLVKLPKKKSKLNPPRPQPTKKSTASEKDKSEIGSTHLILFVLI